MHRKIVTTMGAVAAVALAVIPATAHAGGDNGTTATPEAEPTFSPDQTVVFENRTHPDWKVPAVVGNYDRRLQALDLRVGKCDNYPDAGCVTVRGVNKPNAWWWGRWTNEGNADGHVEFNRAHGRDRYVACHELGHALGLKHHRGGPGCLKVDDYSRHRASTGEMVALRDAYGLSRRGVQRLGGDRAPLTSHHRGQAFVKAPRGLARRYR